MVNDRFMEEFPRLDSPRFRPLIPSTSQSYLDETRCVKDEEVASFIFFVFMEILMGSGGVIAPGPSPPLDVGWMAANLIISSPRPRGPVTFWEINGIKLGK